MAARKSWCPERRDMIWIHCNPQAGREMKDMHPLVVLSPPGNSMNAPGS